MSDRSAMQAASAADADEQAWRAFIGPKNTERYVQAFHKLAGGERAPWHWAACLLTLSWLFYRRRWGWALLYAVLPYVVGPVVVLGLSLLGVAPERQTPFFASAMALVFFVGPGLLGHRLYWSCTHKAIRKLEAQSADRSRLLEQLARRGGTRAWWVAIAPLLVLFLTGLAAGIAVPAYQDAAKRQQAGAAAEPGR